MAKWQFKRTVRQITAHSIIRHLPPAACGQTNVRPVQVRQQRTVFAWVPSKNVERTVDRVWPRRVDRRGCSHGPMGRFRCWRDRPDRCLTFIETEDAANFFVDFQFAEVGRPFGPSHTPTYAADKIGFMNAIPARRSDLYKKEPAQGKNKEGVRNRGLRNAECGLRLLISDCRGLTSYRRSAEQIRQAHGA